MTLTSQSRARAPFRQVLAIAGLLLLAACGTAREASQPQKTALAPAAAFQSVGEASWYGARFHGRQTASGAVYDMNALTAAHRSLPFGTRVRVTNLANGRSVVLTINDRGPYVEPRIIDVLAACRRGPRLSHPGYRPGSDRGAIVAERRRARRDHAPKRRAICRKPPSSKAMPRNHHTSD